MLGNGGSDSDLEVKFSLLRIGAGGEELKLNFS